jgi:hypothetical protein
MKSFKVLFVYDLQWHGLAIEFHKNRVLQKFCWDTCQCVNSYRIYFYLRLLLLEFLYIYASTLFLYNCIISRMNKESSIISGTGAAIWSKTNFGPIGHHHPRSSPIPLICTVPSASAIFKCILQVVFCEGVQHCLRFSLGHLSCVKMTVFKFYLQSGKQRKVGRMGTTVMLFLSKIPQWKRKCEMAHCCDATASSFVTIVWGISSHIHGVVLKHHSSMWNWLFGLPERIPYEQTPWCQRKLWACSWLCFSTDLPFTVSPEPGMPFKHLCMAHAFFPKHLPNHSQGLQGGLSPRANYTDQATDSCRRSYCQLFRIEGIALSAWQFPMAVISVSRPEPLLFLPNSSSIVPSRLSGPHSRLTT